MGKKPKIINDISLLKDGRIIFIVSHKYSNLRHCDKALVFENTKVKIKNYSELIIS
jgi:ABC-type multidrug transport system fused ATPase/permease subunit